MYTEAESAINSVSTAIHRQHHPPNFRFRRLRQLLELSHAMHHYSSFALTASKVKLVTKIRKIADKTMQLDTSLRAIHLRDCDSCHDESEPRKKHAGLNATPEDS